MKIKKSYFDTAEAIAINQINEQIIDIFKEELKFIKNDEVFAIKKPLELLNLINSLGKKNLTFQRFKGLGEMNAEQLWETTLDNANRTLLQVKIDEFDEADQTFSILMGNVVEPRREFIQENALRVENLDI